MTDTLNELRATLDRLDDEIIQLLEQRFQISARVAAAKNGSATFRPGREAAILRRLCHLVPELEVAMLHGIWRHIFAASVAQQQGSLRIGVLADARVTAQWHFPNSLGFTVQDDLNTLFSTVPAKADYILVPCSAADQIARSLFVRDDLEIVAKTPLFAMDSIPPCYVIATHSADESGSDADVYAIRDNDEFKLVEIAGTASFDVEGDNVKWIGKVAI